MQVHDVSVLVMEEVSRNCGTGVTQNMAMLVSMATHGDAGGFRNPEDNEASIGAVTG